MPTQRPPLTGLTQGGYARHRGVSGPYVNKLYHAGRLVLHPDGSIDAEASDRALSVSHDPIRGGKGGGGAITRALRAESADDDEDGGRPAPGDSVTESKRLSAYYKAKTDEADYRARIGELGELSRMRAGVTEAYGALARFLEQCRARISPILAAEGNERRVYELLGKELDAGMTELADTLEALPERVTATQQ